MNGFNLKEIEESSKRIVAIDWDYVEVKNKEINNKIPSEFNKRDRKKPMSDNYIG